VNETKKIALASATGGIIGTLVALIAATTLWWLGLLAGFAAGYLAYEFREVVRTVPVAFRETVAGLPRLAISLVRPRPLTHLSLICTAATYGALYPTLTEGSGIPWLFLIVASTAISLIYYIAFTAIVGFGAIMVERVVPVYEYEWIFEQKAKVAETNDGFSDMQGTHLRTLRWFGEGIVACMGIFPYLAFKVTRLTIRYIHSTERMLCGFYAALGTGLAWTLFGATATTAHAALITVAGGCIAATFALIAHRSMRTLGART